ncbi:MAG: MFS transporter [Candidatus Bathyarchaeota archaeon]|nr:MFS transporter [Candidatus Bathyarchaeota archaeon]
MTASERSKRLSPIFVIVLTVFIDITGYGIIIPLLPYYADEFQAGPAALGILIASFAIMQFLFSPLLGKASDKIGRKPILLLSLLLSLIGFTIFSFANSYLMLLLSRIIAGVATERAVAQAYIADITDHKSRTKELGKIGAALGAGFIIGPFMGGALITYGYSIPGYAAMILTISNILSVILFLPEPKREKGETAESADRSLGYLRKLLASLRKPLLGPTLVILSIVTIAFSTIPVIVPLLGIDYFNFTPLELAFVFIYIGIVQIVIQGFLINTLSKRLGDEKLIALGPILMAIGTILMPSFQNVIIFFLGNSLLAAGFGLINTSIPSFLSKRIALNEQGSILGIASSVASISNIPGPLVIGFIYAFAGPFLPFLISAIILAAAFLLGCKVYSACNLLN